MPVKKSLILAIFAIIVSSFFNAIMAACIKTLKIRNIETFVIVFWRSAISFFFLLGWISLRGNFKALKTKSFKANILLTIRNVMGFFALIFFFYSLKFLSLATATLLFFVSPLFMPLIAFIYEKQKISWKVGLGIVIGFIGITLIIHPGKDIIEIASIYALISGILVAIAQYAIHLLHEKEKEDSTNISFYYFAFLTLLSGGISFFMPEKFWQDLSMNDIFLLFVIGVTGLFYQLFMVYAFKHASPVIVSPFLYSVVLFAMVIDWVVWNEKISVLSFFGMALVVAGVIIKLVYYPRPEEDLED